MKKFLSMVLAAAMVISTVPATAFALDAKATAKVVGSLDLTETDATKVEEKSTVTGHTFIGGSTDYKAPELQLKVTDASYTEDDKKTAPETKFTVSLDNAKFVDKTGAVVTAGNTDQKANFAITVVDDSVLNDAAAPAVSNVKVNDNDEIEVTVTGILEKDDIIKVALNSVLTKTSTGTKATVAVDSDDLDLSTDDITFATVQDDGIKVTLKKVAEVAEEETTELEKDLKIEAAAGDFVQGQEFEIKVSSGFELRTPATQKGTGYTIKQGDDDNKLIVAASSKTDTITVDARDIIIDAATAKSGAVAKLTVKAVKDSTDPKTGKVTEVAGSFKATAEAVEAAKVVGQTVTLSVDEDEDVPVIYSGVDADNHGITDDSDHKSLEVTLKESAAGALDIADKETLTQGDNGLNWKNEDQLFISIMQNYYLPEVQKITADDIKVVRRQGEDNNTKNYFEVTYTDENGNKQTKFYNYVMDDKQTSKDNIVIFEKRIEEVNWKTAQETNPDQYVKENGDTITVSEVEKGLKDGTIIAVDGKKVIKNDGTESIIISDNNQKTENGEVDTDVNEATEKESWKLDENGNLIKTVTADVTTITYTDAKFTSTEQYQTEAERDAAAAEKEKELENANNGKEATVTGTEKTDYTYTGNGTYIPTFTKTVNVKDEEVEWKHSDKKTDYGVRTEEEAVAKVTKEQEKALSNKINDDDDLYLIGVSSDLKVTGHTEDHWYDDSDFLVSGTVSATYAKVTKKTVDQSTFGSLWNDIKALFGKGEATNKKLEDAARKAVEADGGIFVSANWDDWKFGKATIRYVAGVSVKTDEKTSAEEAQNAVQDAALAQAKASGATGVYNVKTTDTDTIAHTSYSYEIDYLEKTGETTTNTAVRTETYENAEVLTGQIIQNLNYIQGNIKLTQKDEAYRKFVDDAKALTQKYQKLLQDAQDAQKDVETAQAKVNELKAEIEALKSNRTSNLGALKELEGKLAVAEQNKKDAEDTLKEILDSLDKAGGELDKVIERLTPAPTPAAPAGGDSAGGSSDTGETVVNPIVLAPAPVAQATVVTQNQAAAQGVTQIADEAAPLAANVEEDTQKTAEEAPKAEEAVNIADEAVPLADVAVESEHAKMSWWWWLIILILGATGYEMYKKHNEKKLKAQAENAGDIEE